MNTDLFIITSPLQLINAIEARKYFKTTNNQLVAVFTEFKSKNKNQILSLINENEWNNVLHYDLRSKDSKTTFFKQIKLIKLLEQQAYNNVFCGDLNSLIKMILANISKKKVYLLDDGAVTINRYLRDLGSKNKPVKKDSFRRLRFNIFGIKTTQKDIINMFTSYKLAPHADEEIIHNNLEFFKKEFLTDTTVDENVYILGQSLSETNIVNRETYLNYIKFIQDYYSDSSILYIPHRAETNLEDIEKLQDDTFTVYHTKLPIELEFINAKKYPMKICSFFSSALFTLNILYPESSIIAFKINIQDAKKPLDTINDIYNYIESSTTIKTVNL